jgi:FtsP/CotA-like multicopper oxidase with cupredoxin domain
MIHSIDYGRRQFLQYSALGAAAAMIPELLLANPKSASSVPTPGFKPDVEIEFSAREVLVPILNNGAETRVQKYFAKLLKGPENTVQSFEDSYLGPALSFVKGQKVRIYFYNNLYGPSIVHWHGMHVPQKSDGHPMYSIEPGERFVYEFEVLNNAGSSFYHSHAHNLTGPQVYFGLAGLLKVTDENEKALGLPAGEYDRPLVIQDKQFNSKGQLQYVRGLRGRMIGFLGDTILVNGKPNAEIPVKSRAYRFRVLNGSNSRIYKLGWDDGTPLTAIGSAINLLEKPETRPYIMLGPSERYDLWLDFSGRPVGSKLILYSLPFSGAMPPMFERMRRMGEGGMGMMGGRLAQGEKFPIAIFNITEKVDDSPKLPARLAPLKKLSESDVDNADNPLPIAITERHMRPLVNGRPFSLDEVMEIEKVKLGSIKKIKIFHPHEAHQEQGSSGESHDMEGMGHGGGRGGMGMRGDRGGGMGMMGGMMMAMAHPIHLHGQQFQVLSRKEGHVDRQDYETVRHGFIDVGWKDTVLVMPGEEIEIIKPFQDFKGLFLYHCHNLEHEDLGMMRNFYVH